MRTGLAVVEPVSSLEDIREGRYANRIYECDGIIRQIDASLRYLYFEICRATAGYGMPAVDPEVTTRNLWEQAHLILRLAFGGDNENLRSSYLVLMTIHRFTRHELGLGAA